jgi:hypothetical protein
MEKRRSSTALQNASAHIARGICGHVLECAGGPALFDSAPTHLATEAVALQFES